MAFSTQAPILIAEDNADDAFLLVHRLRKAGVRNPTRVFVDGNELLAHLRHAHSVGEQPPCIVFLDLWMPECSGFDVLRAAQHEDALRHIPFVLMTGSERPSELDQAASSGAAAVLRKFPSLAMLAATVAQCQALPQYRAAV